MQYLYWRGDNLISDGVLHLASLPAPLVCTYSQTQQPPQSPDTTTSPVTRQGCYVWSQKQNTKCHIFELWRLIDTWILVRKL